MNILISNDDGVFSEGLYALVEALHPHYHIAVVAPDQQRSGASHSCTFAEPVSMRQVSLPGFPDILAYAASGTPADCVRLGCTQLPFSPDLVVTGINHGANLGTHVLYSGTVGAAMEAALSGKPAIATSCCNWNPQHFATAAAATLWALRYVEQTPLPPHMILNLNTPDLPPGQVKGIRLTGLHIQKYDEQHIRFEDPRKNTYYWMDFLEREPHDPDVDDDYHWIQDGYCTLTPIHCDIACYSYMKTMDVSDFSIPAIANADERRKEG